MRAAKGEPRVGGIVGGTGGCSYPGPGRLRAPVVVLAAVAVMAFALALLVGSRPALAQEGGETTTTSATTTSDTTAPDGETTTVTEPGGTGPIVPPPDGFEPLNPGLVIPEMTLQVWPEYDEPEVLVLADVFLPETVTFPYTFSYYVPKGARNTGIAEIDENGQFVYDMTPEITPGQDMDIVTIEVPTYRQLRLEYYYNPGLNTNGQRQFPFRYRVPADADSLAVSVQQPLRSEGFSVDPPLAQTTSGAQGFSFAVETLSNVQAGSEIQLDVSYSKDDAEPSIESEGGSGGGTSEGGGGYFLWILAIVGIGIAGVVGYWFAVRRTPVAASGGKASRSSAGGRKSRAASDKGESGGGPARFCTQCGAKLSKKDRFCSECGHERE